MAWIETIRAKYERKMMRYQSDLTDAEWALLRADFMGRSRKWAQHQTVNAILPLHRICQLAKR